MDTASASVSISWLVGALWALTMMFAAAISKILYGKVTDMADSMEKISVSIGALGTAHARTDQTVQEQSRRLERLEDRYHVHFDRV